MWCICSAPQWDNREFEECLFSDYEKFNCSHLTGLYHFKTFKDFLILKCRKSRTFYRYAKCVKGRYILGVLYGDHKRWDVMPCFSETGYIGEGKEDGLKRLCREELFSDLGNYEEISDGVYCADVKDVKWVGNRELIKGKDEKGKKIALYIYSNDIEDMKELIQKWRSNKHNLGTSKERYFMRDLVIIKKN